MGLLDRVVEGDMDNVGDTDEVEEEPTAEAVTDGVNEEEPVIDDDADSDDEGVREKDTDLDNVGVVDAVSDGVSVLEAVSDGVGDADSDSVDEEETDADRIGTKSYESTKIGSVLLLIICCGLVNWRVRRSPCSTPVEERLVLVKSR